MDIKRQATERTATKADGDDTAGEVDGGEMPF